VELRNEWCGIGLRHGLESYFTVFEVVEVPLSKRRVESGRHFAALSGLAF